MGDGRSVSAGGHAPTKAESFIRGATLRTRGRAGRSAEDRLLCKQEALGSNPSRSTPLEVQPNSAPREFSSDLNPISGLYSDWRRCVGEAIGLARCANGSLPVKRDQRVPPPKT